MPHTVFGNCSSNGSSAHYPAIHPDVITTVQVTATIMCILSILGVCLIIFVYVAYKDMRTTARTMLLHLSVADLIVVISHLVGLYANYKRFTERPNTEDHFNTTNKDPVCVAQAAFTVFGSVASFLWSVCIGIFMVAYVISKQKNFARIMLIIMLVMCWGIPTVLVIYDGVRRYFGYLTIGSTECYIINVVPVGMTGPEIIVAEVLSYELWVYGAFILLPILYGVLFCHIRCRIKPKYGKGQDSRGYATKPSNPDVKLLFVPPIFLLLRVWTVIFGIITFYTENADFKCSIAAAALLIIQGIAVNAQGFANSILFCLLTPPVRQRLYQSLVSCVDRVKNKQVLSNSAKEDDATVFINTSSSSYGSLNPNT